MSSFVSVLDSPASLGSAAASRMLELADEAISARGRFVCAVSGSSMMSALAPLLLESARQGRSFAQWHLFLADERCVPHDHADSNVALVYKHFVTPLTALAPASHQIPSEHIHALDMAALAVSVDQAARAYEADMIKSLNSDFPEFDAIYLGMGPDGHTASLFPVHELLLESGRLIAPITDSPKPPPNRITFTLPLIARARHVVFMAGGAEKRITLKQVLQQPRLPQPIDQRTMLELARTAHFPSQIVHAVSRDIHWFVDQAAVDDEL
jgi:6-phosphogluconolactonase